MEDNQKAILKRNFLAKYLFHDYLWSPTPAFYFGTVSLYLVLKMKWRMTPYYLLPMMMIPITLDYWQREFYVRQFKEDRKEMLKSNRVVQ